MDIFKFTPSVGDTTLDSAMPVSGYTKVTWVERYLDPGEFTIEAPLSSGLKDVLTVGSLISHTNTMEVMIVENHEIPEKIDETTIVKITGRSFESYLEGRAVGVNSARAGTLISPYQMTADYTWNQAVTMINDHIKAPNASANDRIDNFSATTSASGSGTSEARTIPFGDLLKNIHDLLKIDDLGIRTIRRNPFGVSGGSSSESRLQIYKGADKTANIIFTWVTGDIGQTDYLFSNKGLKTSALVVGRFLNVVVDGSETNYDRRFMYVDAQDIDQALTYPPDPAAVTAALAAMNVRGKQALAGQKSVTITQVDLGRNNRYRYRTDYNIGDLVKIHGNFDQIATMRVTEYAEIEDENGVTGHPTLSVPGA